MPYKNPEDKKACQKRWRDAHPEQVAAGQKRWNQTHPEKAAAKCRRWREKNPEYYLKYYSEHSEALIAGTRRWQKKNPEKVKAIGHQARANRRAQMANTNVETLSLDDINRILEKGCFFCGSHERLEMAHDIPVSKGGDTTRPNLFCLCRKCNAKMGVKNLSEVLSQAQLNLN